MLVDGLRWEKPWWQDLRDFLIMSEWVDVPCRWQFMSEGSDIGFGIFLKTKTGERQRAGEMTEVLPNERYNAHLVPEDGTLTCNKPGICKYLCLGLKLLP